VKRIAKAALFALTMVAAVAVALLEILNDLASPKRRRPKRR
jgi:hypothetical protein